MTTFLMWYAYAVCMLFIVLMIVGAVAGGATYRFFVAWFDFWIGAYWDRTKRELYVCPFPMIGMRMRFPTEEREYALFDPYRTQGGHEETIYRSLKLHSACSRCGKLSTLQRQSESLYGVWWAYECNDCGHRGSRVFAPGDWVPPIESDLVKRRACPDGVAWGPYGRPKR